MKEEDKIVFREKLEEEIKKTEQQIEELEEQTQPIPPENSLGRITRMDAINNKSVAEANLRRAKRKMGKLAASMAKIDHPDFGNCSVCSSPIPVGRLMIMPESTHCVNCAGRL